MYNCYRLLGNSLIVWDITDLEIEKIGGNDEESKWVTLRES